MPKKAEPIAQSAKPIGDRSKDSLREEVKQALLNVLRSKDASAASKASAGRTLLEYFSEAESVGADRRRGADLTASELDDAIAKLEA